MVTEQQFLHSNLSAGENGHLYFAGMDTVALAEKYGSSPQAWLIVSVVGAFLIDLVNALIITWFAAL